MSRFVIRLHSALHRCLKLLPPRLALRIRARVDHACGVVEPEICHVPRAMKRRRLAVDVGANNGVTTMILSRYFERVESIEANPDLAAFLKPALPAHARIWSCALSEKPGTAELRIPVQSGVTLTGWASLDKPHVGDETTWKRVPVEARTLDSMHFTDVDLIKIDVEGHELAVLEGASDTIARNRPWLIVETWDQHRDAVKDYFTRQNYHVTTLYQLCGIHGSEQNLVFIPD